MVISSDEVAREMFKNHDVDLAGRKIYESMKGNYGLEGSIITSQYGPHWRMLRRLCTTEIFNSSRLDAMKDIRRKCIDRMVKSIEDVSAFGTNPIDIGRFFLLFNFNLIGNLMFSKDLLETDYEKGAKFFYHAGQIIEFAAKPNVADFVPILKRFDPQGIKEKTQIHVEHAFEIVREFMNERIQANKDSMSKKQGKDYLDVLLEFQGDGIEEPSKFSSTIINVVIFDT
ncbi:Cytochrome P450 [Corchorus capsularis]|uniref:Cytochrome P450 n=1 Tax=Corchorus capsularis TaxID=210143 RepID=A0A1R3IHH8_COCAP|nr:Cytochrome P450 [Corchorus capsularis]